MLQYIHDLSCDWARADGGKALNDSTAHGQGDRLGLARVAADGHHGRARGSQRLRGGEADPAGPAEDEGFLAREGKHC